MQKNFFAAMNPLPKTYSQEDEADFSAPAARTLIGLRLDDPRVPTPSFVLDDEKLQSNLDRVKRRAQELGVTLRPHLKTHKSIAIARRQMETPYGPATVSTLAEARYFAANGVTDLLYAVGIAPQKLAEVKRIRDLGCNLKIILDSAEAGHLVSAFCRQQKTTIPVLLEIDVDGHRSGIQPDSEELLAAAQSLTDGAQLVGVMTHAGDSYECTSRTAIAQAAEAERAGIVHAAQRLRDAGYTISIVSDGSTPTLMESKSEQGVTEIRAGVSAFFDLFMMNLGVCSVNEIAGSVLATVIGRQLAKHRVILDSGFLALSRDRGTQRQKHDFGYGLVCDLDGKPLANGTITLTGTNQEHGILTLPEDSPLSQADFPIGRRVRILPNHACPTAAPYAHLLLVRQGVIVDVLDHVRGWE